MFKVKDRYFSNVPCPRLKHNQSCDLINCLFSHDRKRSHEQVEIDDSNDINDTNDIKEDAEPLKDPEFILPKEMVRPPTTIQVRKQNIIHLAKVLSQMQPSLKTPKLAAIDEEFKIASSNSNFTYSQAIKRRVYEIQNPNKYKRRKTELTNEDYYDELTKLVIPPTKLQKYGYIMEIPEAKAPKTTKVCRRCGHEFKLEDQTIPIHCAFHPGKTFKRKDRTRVYTCCKAVVGDNETEACSSYNHHVFYWENAEEMQDFLPFKKTTSFPKHENALKAIGIDCEMGFTTKGFELLRITAVDFFSNEEVLDILVKPLGEIIDLNTRWSGIAEIKKEAVSFDDLIKVLSEIMDQDTILIGHGLENDMNAMRLIHHKIVDTAILYPRLKTSPTFRYPLKWLVFTYLNKTIQEGEHDSGEDASGAIDVVKHFIRKEFE